jgi:hypothetical protein
MLEVAEADLELGFVHPQACRKSLTERVDAHGRAFPRDAMVLNPCASVFGRCLPEGQREEVKERARLRLPGTECAV